jgi:hypothetical protein
MYRESMKILQDIYSRYIQCISLRYIKSAFSVTVTYVKLLSFTA